MILIFDTYTGLCNQFYDIQCAINLCIINNISFSFRFASYRNNNLTSWYNVPFSSLFDITFLSKYNLYIPFEKIQSKLNNDNTYNLNNSVCCNQFLSRENIIDQLNNLNKEFVVLKQFWDIYLFKQIVVDAYSLLLPSFKIMNKYLDIKNELCLEKNNYNFIHYRYEHDFVNHFKLTNMKNLVTILNENHFPKKELKIYIATTNLVDMIQNDKNLLKHEIVFKNENNLVDWNFEEKAFLDFMIGLNSNQVVGHHNSSFSVMLNNLKGTNYYYN
jgi:hypothetical protein